MFLLNIIVDLFESVVHLVPVICILLTTKMPCDDCSIIKHMKEEKFEFQPADKIILNEYEGCIHAFSHTKNSTGSELHVSTYLIHYFAGPS